MQWIRCDFDGFEILGLRHVRRLSVEAGAEARTQTQHHADGSYSSTTHPALPGHGWLIIAWCGNSGPRCLGCYEYEPLARSILAVIFQELREGTGRAVDVPVIAGKMKGRI